MLDEHLYHPCPDSKTHVAGTPATAGFRTESAGTQGRLDRCLVGTSGPLRPSTVPERLGRQQMSNRWVEAEDGRRRDKLARESIDQGHWTGHHLEDLDRWYGNARLRPCGHSLPPSCGLSIPYGSP